jgi:hypothetical protein
MGFEASQLVNDYDEKCEELMSEQTTPANQGQDLNSHEAEMKPKCLFSMSEGDIARESPSKES